jgi:16S rRNA (adenine(1408)-N(1))-methyltransferase
VTVDLGTGDGRLPFEWARAEPDRLFVGVDADAANLREFSNRGVRDRLVNLLYVRATVEALPAELAGACDRLTVVLPWGTLLAAVASPSVAILRGIRALCLPQARLTIVLGTHADRDRAELARLRIPSFDAAAIASAYLEGGFERLEVRPLRTADLSAWPSTWRRRLSFGGDRSFVRIDARAR